MAKRHTKNCLELEHRGDGLAYLVTHRVELDKKFDKAQLAKLVEKQLNMLWPHAKKKIKVTPGNVTSLAKKAKVGFKDSREPKPKAADRRDYEDDLGLQRDAIGIMATELIELYRLAGEPPLHQPQLNTYANWCPRASLKERVKTNELIGEVENGKPEQQTISFGGRPH